MARIVQDSPSWQAGYNLGLSGQKPRRCPPEVPNPLAFWSGFIDGKAAHYVTVAKLCISPSTPDTRAEKDRLV
jgi:hypothetical protein